MRDRRRTAGYALWVAGGALLVMAGGRYASGAIQQDRARTLWEEQLARAGVAASRVSLTAASHRRTVTEGYPIARLVIPRLGLDHIVFEGVSEQALNAGPGHLPGSVLPGQPGNAIISAHRDRHFNDLGKLQIGDTIETQAIQERVMWVVTGRKIVGKDAPALFNTVEPTLTLSTCWPIRYLGTAPDRLIITAKPIGSPAHRRIGA
jgi:LPXTG-site transpeptidase (sortase) family protein